MRETEWQFSPILALYPSNALAVFLLSLKSMYLKWAIYLAFAPKNSEGLGQY